MEKDIREFETALTGYNDKTGTSFIRDPVILKHELNEINSKLKDLIETYAAGEISLSNITFELDLLNNRLSAVSLLVAA